jgi:hypothetical protein
MSRTAAHCFVFTIVFVGGCSVFGKHELTYIGHRGELESLATPTGFAISPSDLDEILLSHRGPSKMAEDYYHNGDSYYVINSSKGVNHSEALTSGTIINGQTGEVFDRRTLTWTLYRRTGPGPYGSPWTQSSDHDGRGD